MYVTEYFTLPTTFKQDLQRVPVSWGFGPFSETIFYSRYSRLKPDGTNETWADTVIRNIEGMFSILKTMAKRAMQPWDEKYWSELAIQAAKSMFHLKWSPPGRGMWAQGTQFVYERGSDALNNCAFVDVQDLSRDAAWLMDKLMKGVGVGFSTHRYRSDLVEPDHERESTWTVGDSREGWTESVQALIDSYRQPGRGVVKFEYSEIRPAGAPIRGFGGVSAGYQPLQQLHESLRDVLSQRVKQEIDDTRLVADVMNLIGVCVIAGNVRRSAEIALGKAGDETFINLKNYGEFDSSWNLVSEGPSFDRMAWGHMSNNSVLLEKPSDYPAVDDLFPRIVDNGEPGIVNMDTIQQYGRLGESKIDTATGINPCGEIPLESYETCNLAIVYPTRCRKSELMAATGFATLYSIAVSLLPAGEDLTNKVVERNHRIGVGVSGLADWWDEGTNGVTMHLNAMYQSVKKTTKYWSDFFGINMPIRMTTVKPDGTASLLAGVSPGMHWPWSPYCLRRVRQSASSPVAERLISMGVPYEPDVTDPNGTLVFEFPITYNHGKTRAQSDVSAVEQLRALIRYQSAWADNSVSATITFKPQEVEELRRALRESIHDIKSVSFLPAQEETQSYQQAPFEAISEADYRSRIVRIGEMDWRGLGAVDTSADKYCDSESCAI